MFKQIEIPTQFGSARRLEGEISVCFNKFTIGLSICIPQNLTRNTAMEVATTVKALHNETESLLVGRASLVRCL